MRCRRGGPNTQRSEVQGVWREEDEMDGQTWAGLRMSSEQGRFRPSGQGGYVGSEGSAPSSGPPVWSSPVTCWRSSPGSEASESAELSFPFYLIFTNLSLITCGQRLLTELGISEPHRSSVRRELYREKTFTPR